MSTRNLTEPGLGQLLIYALPALALALPTLILFVNLPTLYFEQFGLGLTLVGLVLMLTRIGDLLLDPIIGRWSDRQSAHGQRLMILIGCAFCAPGLLLIVYPVLTPLPSLLIGLSLLYFGWTLIQIPYLALLPMLHPDSYQRTRLASWREGFGVVGLLLSAALPALLLHQGASSLEAMRALILLTLLLGGLSLALLLMKLDWPQRRPAPPQGWSDLLRNLEARVLLGTWFINGLANGIPAVLFPLYITQVLGLPEQNRGTLILLYFACAVGSLPLWLMLSRVVDKDRLWRWAMGLAVLAFLPASFLGSGDAGIFLLICVITGATLGADLALPQAMQADVTDWHRLSSGQDQTALLFAFWNMATKLALALSAVLALGLVEFSGFDPESNQAGSLALIYALLPCVLKLTAIMLLRRINLGRAWHESISKRIEQRGL